MPELELRHIEWKGNGYLRFDDVIRMLQELSAPEATDVRDRVQEFINTLVNQKARM